MCAYGESITRRVNTVLTNFQEEFKGFYCRADFDTALSQLKKAKNRSSYPSKLAALWDMLENCGIHEYEKTQEAEYYEALIREANIPDSLEDQMLYAIYTHFQEYPAPQEYMERLVDRLSLPSDADWRDDPLRLRILKQFIKYGDYLSGWDFGGQKAVEEYCGNKLGKKMPKTVDELLTVLDDGVFECLVTADKKLTRPRGKYGLLKIADDLGNGKFRAGGSTREQLYLFAMVYNMTFYSGAEGEQPDPQRDLDRNLFQDYYTNNLMRFLTLDPKEKLSKFERDPSGQAINYKNFAEMVCLYYISKDMDPCEKLRRSNLMIKRLKEKGTQPAVGQPEGKAAPEGETAYYRRLFTSDVLELDENAFEAFLFENYNCDAKGKSGNKGVFQLEVEQNSAFAEYQRIREDLKALDVEPSSCNYGLWFIDMAAEGKSNLQSFPDRWPGIDRKKYDKLLTLLKRMNYFIGYTPKEKESDQTAQQEHKEGSVTLIEAFRVKSAKEVTRSNILVAYYYLYNAMNELTSQPWQKSLQEVFWDFKLEADQRLRAAGYQELNGKSIFDVLLVFSIYARLNV